MTLIYVTHENESRHTNERVTSHTRECACDMRERVTSQRVTSHMVMSHVTHLNESCYTHLNESRLTHANVPASCVSKSCHWLMYDRGENHHPSREKSLFICVTWLPPLRTPILLPFNLLFTQEIFQSLNPYKHTSRNSYSSPEAFFLENRVRDSYIAANNHIHTCWLYISLSSGHSWIWFSG